MISRAHARARRDCANDKPRRCIGRRHVCMCLRTDGEPNVTERPPLRVNTHYTYECMNRTYTRTCGRGAHNGHVSGEAGSIHSRSERTSGLPSLTISHLPLAILLSGCRTWPPPRRRSVSNSRRETDRRKDSRAFSRRETEHSFPRSNCVKLALLSPPRYGKSSYNRSEIEIEECIVYVA